MAFYADLYNCFQTFSGYRSFVCQLYITLILTFIFEFRVGRPGRRTVGNTQPFKLLEIGVPGISVFLPATFFYLDIF